MEERVQYLYDLWAVLTQSVFIHVQCLSIKALCSTEGSRMSKLACRVSLYLYLLSAR